MITVNESVWAFCPCCGNALYFPAALTWRPFSDAKEPCDGCWNRAHERGVTIDELGAGYAKGGKYPPLPRRLGDLFGSGPKVQVDA